MSATHALPRLSSTKVCASLAALLVILAVPVACSSGSDAAGAGGFPEAIPGGAGAPAAGGAGVSSGQGGAGATGGMSSAGAAGGGGGAGAAGAPGGGCKPGDPEPAGSYCLGKVSGSLIGLDGAPVGPMGISVCGGLCIAGKVSSQGLFSIPVGRLMPSPGLSVPLGTTLFSAYVIALQQEGDVHLPPLLVARLPDEGAPFPAAGVGAAISSGGVTLHLDPGTEVTLDDLLFETDEQRRFRAVAVPPEKVPPFVPGGLVFGALYAFGPSGAKLAPPARATFATPSKWPPGALVEIYAHGLDEWSAIPPWASMSKVAVGHVSEGGDTVALDPGEGLPVLTWAGLRLVP